MEFKTKRLLTIPVLKLTQDQPRHIRATGVMHIGKPQKAKEGEKAKDPATLLPCVNLEDSTICQIVVSAVVKSVLTDDYPGDTYVGLCFKITKRGRSVGKQYNQFDVEEIEDPAAPEILGGGGAGTRPVLTATGGRGGGGSGRRP
jgi:hypothetical protein